MYIPCSLVQEGLHGCRKMAGGAALFRGVRVTGWLELIPTAAGEAEAWN